MMFGFKIAGIFIVILILFVVRCWLISYVEYVAELKGYTSEESKVFWLAFFCGIIVGLLYVMALPDNYGGRK